MSDLTVYELSKHTLRAEAENISRLLEHNQKLVFCTASQEDRELARTKRAHYADALHAVLAKRHGADVLVTQNVKDFREAGIDIRSLDDF